jgi:hypothetical protein
MWETKPSADWDLVKLIFRRNIKPPPVCSSILGMLLSCKCLAKATKFLDPGLMGERVVSELLEAYHMEVKTWLRGGRGSYRMHWDDMEAFVSRDLFHLGATLHGVLKQFRLGITIDCLDVAQYDFELEKLGVPGTGDQLARFVDALNLLCLEEPHPITYAFHDKLERTPSHMKSVFQALSKPFHKLRTRGFDVRVTYTSLAEDSSRHRNHGFRKWDLGSDGWALRYSDVWSWTVYDRKINFTRCNAWFQPKGGMGESFTSNPNGPVGSEYSCGFRFKVPIGEHPRVSV